MPALTDVEREFRASRANKLAPSPDSNSGSFTSSAGLSWRYVAHQTDSPLGYFPAWKAPKAPHHYALVTCGPRDKNKFYSNGLDLVQAFGDNGFFQCRPPPCRRL